MNEVDTLLTSALESDPISLPAGITIPLSVLALVLLGIVLHDRWWNGSSR